MSPVGVARPSAHGHATDSTSQQVSSARSRLRGATRRYQTRNVSAAAPMTPGTNQRATLSAKRCTGAFSHWACRTIWMICSSTDALPSASAETMAEPERLRLPPMTLSPGALSTGMLSPVSMDSSTAHWPLTTVPSTGTRSPGRMRTRSCSAIWSTGSSTNASPRCTMAVRGCRCMSLRMAELASPAATCSIYLPKRMSESSTPSDAK